MCSVGRMLGSSTSVPSATWTKAPSSTTEYRSEPQIPQRVLVVSPELTVDRFSAREPKYQSHEETDGHDRRERSGRVRQ
jgi:hypothetical protein